MADAAPSAQASWYCHSCRATVHPLMTPEPTCPQCHEQFLEQIDESADDPRDFDLPDGDDGGFLPAPNMLGPFFVGAPGGDNDLAGGGAPPLFQHLFQQMMGLAGAPGQHQHAHEADDAHGGLFGAAEHGQAYGQAADRQPTAPPEGTRPPRSPQGPPPAHGNEAPVRNLAEFLASAFGSPPPAAAQQQQDDRAGSPSPARAASDPGPGMRQDGAAEGQQGARAAPAPADGPGAALMRLFSALGAPVGEMQNGGGIQFVFAPGGGGAGGQFGDYATQQGFDDIVTQLMEQAQGQYGPRPAPEEMISELPKVKMTQDLVDSPSITDCAVCKDPFAVDEDCLKLPCKHIFHEDCVKPWLQQSGTCPVCRHQLVEQPSSHAPRADPLSPTGVAPAGEGAFLPDDAHQNQMPGAFPFNLFFGGGGGGAGPPHQQQRQRGQRREDDHADMPPLEDLD